MLGLIYFGQRGNLIIIGCQNVDPRRIAEAIDRSAQVWRIALGPAPIIAALAEFETRPALVDRVQLYYSLSQERIVSSQLHAGVRPAERKDLRRLFEAALDLNASDLNVAGWRVNKSWLKDSIKSRVKRGQTLVIGEPGMLECKVDVGSAGPGGLMLEGVYTWPQARGRGLARAIVTTAAEQFLAEHSRVCLHVDSENMPARRAYEAAGMETLDSCRLLLRD
jgi:predicted GNAT family acetyltransferase